MIHFRYSFHKYFTNTQKLHITATLGIKSIHNSISQVLYQYTKLHINATLGIKSIHNSISHISKTIQFNLNLQPEKEFARSSQTTFDF